jgi:hypothetical protein
MGRRNAAAVAAVLAAAGATGCGPFGGVNGSLGPLADAVHASARTGEAFQLSAATDFDWDRVYVFGPYSTPDSINEEIGFEWDDADDSAIEGADWMKLIVFVEDGQVVRAFDHDNGDGEFACLASPYLEGGLTRREAFVRVKRTPNDGGSLDYVFLAHPRNDRDAARTRKCLELFT